ncbi:2-polyprenyl-3-methyl-6-methoxy-1,4-benzoquinone monooxygenase [Halovibrio sp. HP20-50]|uniref:2-polyprenyl-3-methyl-6-methoxy-1,4-benzoquinone monooxygenase n=1 Tax=Halovibrio sp. HP20-59 TaxID=3080275 RepID=UPI00294AE1E2|nr:2-polyprenyl-3-methyl-6-methoxy-1,4-benzoquinone monooxygenase [Halovibrio sp. HP20-59]MEA2120438.1 2-polyprenyl-3-methyl-6-methoxy-1,4-benzoquinone monooxygenase [Halovibrio sp. HP20-59]
MDRQHSRSDRMIHQFDTFLRTLIPRAASAQRSNPAEKVADGPLDDQERRLSSGLMRISHTSEVCVQALYQGQSVTGSLDQPYKQREQSALEKIDHLAWCDERLAQLQSRTSYLNPLFYVASFGIGAATGAVSERIGLGTIAATQEQVAKQLEVQQTSLPAGDHRSRAILRKIAVDDAHHAQLALEAGGVRFPAPVKWGMRFAAKVMSKSVYHL